jgi:glutamine amidotransferase
VCRHFAYLGPAVALSSLLGDPPFGLVRQSWAPRRQRYGTVNADGYGVGWYADGDPVPARYRRDCPMWADTNLPDLARVLHSGAVLAAVRSGTEGMGFGESAAAPFAAGRWLFSHNGAVPGWPGSMAGLAGDVPASELLTMEAPTDSALLWVLVQRCLRAGVELPDAVADVVTGVAIGRLNLLATDGTEIAATTWGDTLCWRTAGGGTIVASEPFDDGPGWHDVPDRSLLVATADGVTVTPLAPHPTADPTEFAGANID